MTLIDPELGKLLAESQWVSDGVNDEEQGVLVGSLHHIANSDHELAKLLVASPWIADGVYDIEWDAFEVLLETGWEHMALTKVLASSAWVAEGVGRGEPLMSFIIDTLLKISLVDRELAMTVASTPWVVDGVSSVEAVIIRYIGSFMDSEPEKSRRLIDLIESRGDISTDEKLFLDLVRIFARSDLAGLTVASYAKGRLSESLTGSLLNNLAFSDSDIFHRLPTQPWFADGLDDREAVLVTVITEMFRRSPSMAEKLLQAYFIQSRTVSLPLAGDVDIWVLQHDPFPPEDNLLTRIEEAARISEVFLGVPFPTNDIILLVYNEGKSLAGFYGAFMGLNRNSRGEVESIPHETAHYYLQYRHWFGEGGASFMETYINDQTGIKKLEDRKVELSEASSYLVTQGIENLRMYVYCVDVPGCPVGGAVDYVLGENFLLNIFEVIGEEAMGKAIAEMYLSDLATHQLPFTARSPSATQHWRDLVEEDTYRIFLKHAPIDSHDEFKELYRRLHGGAFAFPETDFSDEHGDDPASASEIRVGKAVQGKLDYMFDFDYFQFRAEQGEKYRVNVDHESLGFTSRLLKKGV